MFGNLVLIATPEALQGTTDSALALARRAVADAPDAPLPLFRLCRLLLERGDAEANRIGPQLERFPSCAPGWCELGGTLLRMRQLRAALLAFARAADAAPDLAPAHTGRGLCCRAMGDDDGAVAAFERAVALDRGQAEAWFGLGGLYQDRGAHEAAVAAYRAALQARPGLHEAAFNLGVVLLECGQLDSAMASFAVALESRPDSFGRIAQALVSGSTGCLWLEPDRLRQTLLELVPLGSGS